MITGVVTPAREAVLPLVLSVQDGRSIEIEAVIDTGFDGFITLPPVLIRQLDLPLLGRVRAGLGDGSEVGMAAFEAILFWEGKRRSVLALEAGDDPLVGMGTLLGHRLTMDIESHGAVRVEPLPFRLPAEQA